MHISRPAAVRCRALGSTTVCCLRYCSVFLAYKMASSVFPNAAKMADKFSNEEGDVVNNVRSILMAFWRQSTAFSNAPSFLRRHLRNRQKHVKRLPLRLHVDGRTRPKGATPAQSCLPVTPLRTPQTSQTQERSRGRAPFNAGCWGGGSKGGGLGGPATPPPPVRWC